MTQSQKEECLVKVDPVNRVIKAGERYDYQYTFTEVFVEDVPDDIECSVVGAEMWWEDGDIHYQYGDKTTIILREDGAYCNEDAPMLQAENQAYYALSILSGRGLVGRFSHQ